VSHQFRCHEPAREDAVPGVVCLISAFPNLGLIWVAVPTA
jgi:hypothetical protein